MSQAQLAASRPSAGETTFAILFAVSFCHLLNDMMQALLPAIYPTLKASFHLSFAQIGLMTLAFQLTASLLQPAVGFYADSGRMPFSLPIGMVFTLVGLVLLSLARSYARAAGRCRADGARLVGVSPRILARRPHGVGRPPRAGAIAVPGRRQCRLGARAR